jgi:hypothetical protein
MKNLTAALKASMLSADAVCWINSKNDKEAEFRWDNPNRPVFVYTTRVELTPELESTLRAAISKSWQVHGFVHYVVANEYAAVLRAVDRSGYGVIYPNGELARGRVSNDVPLRTYGWSRPVPDKTVAAEVTIIRQQKEQCPAGPIKANGMWETVETFGNGR